MHGDGKHNNTKWWTTEDETEQAGDIVQAARAVDEATCERSQANLENYCYYGSFGAPGITSSMTTQLGSSRLARNVIASATDTLISELMQTDPRALFVSAGGDWDTQNRAEKLTTYADDMCDYLRINEVRQQFLRDGLISGLGIIRPYVEAGEILAERIFPSSFLIDDRTSVDCTPRTCYVRRYIDRDQLAGKYPDHKATIDLASLPDDNVWVIDNAGQTNKTYDALEVTEAWHLPSHDGADDGMHCICIADALLYSAPYERPYFPMAFFRPLPASRGFWGESMVRRAAPQQVELNKHLRRLQHIHHMTANGPILFLQSTQGVPASHITNRIGTIVPTPTGQPPTVVQLPGATPEFYSYLDRLQNYIFEEFAVNEMAAQGTKPAGLTSGKALRLYTDTTSRRFLEVKRCAERTHVDFCRELIACERTLTEEYPEREVLYERYGAKVRVAWSKLDIDDKFLRIKAFPVSALPDEPAARMEALEEMRKDGVITQEQFWSLAPTGDMEQVRDDFVAPTKLLKQRFGMLLDGEDYQAPEPYMNLALGMELASRMLQHAEMLGADEDRLDLLRQWITDAKRLLERQQADVAPPPQAEAPMDMGMPPQGPPGPVPPGIPPELMMEGGGMPPMPGVPPDGIPPDGMPPMPPDMMGIPPGE